MKPFLQSVGILVWVILSTGRSQAGVRLLTGDANGAFYDQDTRIFDVSGDGNRVLFLTGPADSGNTPGIPVRGLYVRDIADGTLRLLVAEPSAEGDAAPIVDASMSDDAGRVAWQTSALNVYWHDASTDETRLLNPGSPGTSSRPIMSADGHRVAFCSLARNLVADVSLLPAVGRAAVLLYDSVANTTTVASLTHDGKGLLTGLPGPDPSLEFDFSADGKWVVFSTDDLDVHPERLLLPVPNLTWVYRRQVETGQVDPVVRDAAGLVPLGVFTLPRCNGNASRVLFAGTALGIGGDGGLVDGYTFPGGTDLYAKDIPAGMVWRVTLTVDGSPGNAPYPGTAMAFSRDGRVAVFGTKGTNHVSEPTDLLGGADMNPNDLFRVELADNGTAQLSWVTRPVSGTDNVAYYFGPHLPADGRYVAFLSSNPRPLLGTGPALTVWEHGYAVGQVDPVVVDDGYAGWAAGLPAANRGPLDLPFGDGVNNLRKFVHGLAAASSDGTGLPSAEVLPGSAVGLAGDDRPYLVVTVRTRRPLPAGYGVAVRSGASLSALATAPASVPASGPPVPDGPVDLHRYVYPVPVGSEAVDGYLELEVFGP